MEKYTFLIFSCIFNGNFGFAMAMDFAYSVDYFVITDQNMTHSEASDFCHAHTFQIASVLSSSEKNKFNLAINEKPERNRFWVSASDLYSEGKFYWSVGGSSYGRVSNFIIGRNLRRLPELLCNCVEFIKSRRQYISASCSLERAVPVCEHRKITTTTPSISTTTQHMTTTPSMTTATLSMTTTTQHMTTTPSMTTATPSMITTTSSMTTTTETSTTTEFSADLCEGSYDEITFMRNEIIVFQGNLLYRLQGRFQSEPRPEPVRIDSVFSLFTSQRVDAAFQNIDGSLILFTGNQYWRYTANFEYIEGPKLLTELGLPDSVTKIDGAFLYNGNLRIYVFSGDQYWRMDNLRLMGMDNIIIVDDGYPLLIDTFWPGVPNNIDSVFQYLDGQIYFFKNIFYWKFDEDNDKLSDIPFHTSSDWLNCFDFENK